MERGRATCNESQRDEQDLQDEQDLKDEKDLQDEKDEKDEKDIGSRCFGGALARSRATRGPER
jgi:hypothetical protein